MHVHVHVHVFNINCTYNVHVHVHVHVPTGKNISTGSCNSVQCVVAVGCELHCLEIQPSALVETRYHMYCTVYI